VHDPHVLVSGSYDFIKNLDWMKQLAGDITKFDNTLFGFVKLSKTASGGGDGIYWPAMAIVLASAGAQYYQTKQLSPVDKNARKLRHILKEAGEGHQADNAEINAAMGRNMRYFVPVMIFLVTLNIPATLALYLLTGSLVALAQQAYLLRQDVTKLEASVDKTPVEAEVVSRPTSTSNKKSKKTKSVSKRRR
jgi:membrane protein insertase Oxa1/YidC/SpoIIIJ